MNGDAVFLALCGLGMAAYFGWLLRSGLKSGMLGPPGAGEPLSRTRSPKLFRFSTLLYGLVIALGIAISVIAVTGWQPFGG